MCYMGGTSWEAERPRDPHQRIGERSEPGVQLRRRTDGESAFGGGGGEALENSSRAKKTLPKTCSSENGTETWKEPGKNDSSPKEKGKEHIEVERTAERENRRAS